MSDAQESSTYDTIGTVSSATLFGILEPVSELTNEAVLEFDADGLSIEMADPANVAMALCEVPAGCFGEYSPPDSEIGITTDRLLRVVNLGPDDDLVRLKWHDDWEKLQIESGPYSTTVAALSPDTVRGRADLPNMDLPIRTRLPSETLREAVEYLEGFGKYVQFEYRPDKHALALWSEGSTDDAEFVVAGEHLPELTPHHETVRSRLSVDYLHNQTEILPGDTDVTVVFGSAFPVNFLYNLPYSEATVEYFQAPRIGEVDD